MEVAIQEKTGLMPGKMTSPQRLSMRPVLRLFLCCLSFTVTVGAVNANAAPPAGAGRGAGRGGFGVFGGPAGPTLLWNPQNDIASAVAPLQG